MKLKINGLLTEVPQNQSVASLVLEHRLNPKAVVIEHNGRILEPDQWETLVLSENDCVEIISFVGGG